MPQVRTSFSGPFESIHPWPGAELLQAGGKGLVLSSEGNYTTAFFEAFIDDTFIRGEGQTLAEAETNAWNKYQAYNKCPKHEWEPRNYTNGVGFCKNCNKFKSKAFTPEDLGFTCHECKIPTYYSSSKKEDGSTIFGCEEHVIRNEYPSQLEKLFTSLGE